VGQSGVPLVRSMAQHSPDGEGGWAAWCGTRGWDRVGRPADARHHEYDALRGLDRAQALDALADAEVSGSARRQASTRKPSADGTLWRRRGGGPGPPGRGLER
jgi:hypothetical protein